MYILRIIVDRGKWQRGIVERQLPGSQIVFTPPRTSQLASMLGLWIPGSGSWDWIPPTMARIRSRRTKATLIYRRTKNLRAVQLLLGHTKLESTVRYLGIEVDDALEMAEQTEA
jgi:integrase